MIITQQLVIDIIVSVVSTAITNIWQWIIKGNPPTMFTLLIINAISTIFITFELIKGDTTPEAIIILYLSIGAMMITVTKNPFRDIVIMLVMIVRFFLLIRLYSHTTLWQDQARYAVLICTSPILPLI